ncbi:MAG: hypothetical protein M1136_03595 [Chloroflexi bacterium]|nr:hypothetical protein [Chloroflexota bacterium]
MTGSYDPGIIWLSRAYEMMGLKNALAYGVEIFTLLLLTEETASFGRLVQEKGLKAALEKWDRVFRRRED